MKQYNFKISSELEEKVKKALEDSGLNGKSELLEEMVTVYSSHLVNRDSEVNLDISAYKHINSKTKEILEKTFNHILSSMDYNFSTVLQEKIFIEDEKKRLEDKSTELDNLVDKLKIEQLEECKVLETKYEDKINILLKEKENLNDELDKKSLSFIQLQKEFSAISTIAEQTSSIINENKELRAKVLLMEKEHREELSNLDKRYKEEITKTKKNNLENIKALEEKHLIEVNRLKVSINKFEESLLVKDKKLFEVSHILGRCEEDLKIIKEKRDNDLNNFKKHNKENQIKMDSVMKEFNDISSLYNQLIGKIEIFERFGGSESNRGIEK